MACLPLEVSCSYSGPQRCRFHLNTPNNETRSSRVPSKGYSFIKSPVQRTYLYLAADYILVTITGPELARLSFPSSHVTNHCNLVFSNRRQFTFNLSLEDSQDIVTHRHVTEKTFVQKEFIVVGVHFRPKLSASKAHTLFRSPSPMGIQFNRLECILPIQCRFFD
jgi:hypothetical protein